MFGKKKITIKKNNKKILIVSAQIYSIEIKLLAIEFDYDSKTNM